MATRLQNLPPDGFAQDDLLRLRCDDFHSALNDFKLAREVNPRYACSWLAEAKTALRLDQRDQAKVSINEDLKLMARSNEALTLKEELSVNG